MKHLSRVLAFIIAFTFTLSGAVTPQAASAAQVSESFHFTLFKRIKRSVKKKKTRRVVKRKRRRLSKKQRRALARKKARNRTKSRAAKARSRRIARAKAKASKARRISAAKRAALYARTTVRYRTREKPGTIIIETKTRHLYHVLGNGKATRYGVAVGKQGFSWSGTSRIRRKVEWPTWTPPAEMIKRKPRLAKYKNGQPGGPANPLGAAALYLYQGKRDTLYRIHGTNNPRSIGSAASSGCIRMKNKDIQHLYSKVGNGTKVIVN
ncbi:MAG: L,D-transpeptidase [Rhizobiaceae bacterium]